jgi:hypothetical protein
VLGRSRAITKRFDTGAGFDIEFGLEDQGWLCDRSPRHSSSRDGTVWHHTAAACHHHLGAHTAAVLDMHALSAPPPCRASCQTGSTSLPKTLCSPPSALPCSSSSPSALPTASGRWVGAWTALLFMLGLWCVVGSCVGCGCQANLSSRQACHRNEQFAQARCVICGVQPFGRRSGESCAGCMPGTHAVYWCAVCALQTRAGPEEEK